LRRRLLLVLGLAALALLVREGLWYQRFLGLASGHAAKVAASCVLVGGRDLEAVRAEELAPFGFLELTVDRERGLAEASVLGLWRRRAVFRPGLGATLVHDPERALEPASIDPVPGLAGDGVWPAGERVDPPPFDEAGLSRALDAAFAEPEPERPRRTRAVVVVHRGRIVAERYAAGFGPDRPQHGWSMTKSLMNALCGILVADGRLALADQAPIAAWQGAGDPRVAITVDQLLRMESGLGFVEAYEDPDADALRMLFGSDDMAAFAAAVPPIAAPDRVWSYSSGTSVLLARVVAEAVGADEAPTFARDRLFAPLGMRTALIEPDAAGTPVGSSMAWASARDWARFGLLYLGDGVFGGRRVLPEDWVRYSCTPTPHAPAGSFGAHFWLNAGDGAGRRAWPSARPDLFWAAGYQGQYLVVAPSRDAVLVRLGQTAAPAVFDIEGFCAAVLEALPR
jgi:CubicO group peptidase (beta-lactamase class C family)